MVRALTDAGLPVVGHIGLTPQTSAQQGGLGMQGKNALAAKRVIDDAKALQDAGAVAIVLECVPRELAWIVTSVLSVPSIGIGAGPDCSGQVLVMNDLLGFATTSSKCLSPFFARQFAQAGHVMQTGVKNYVSAVRNGSFPEDKHSVRMKPRDTKELLELLRKATDLEDGYEGVPCLPSVNLSNVEDVCMTTNNPSLALSSLKRVLIVGAGSMGCTLAAVFHAAGAQVSIASAWRARRDAFQGRGVTIQGVRGSMPYKLQSLEVFDHSEALPHKAGGCFDCVVVASKAPVAVRLLEFAAAAAANDAIILGVQNGVGGLRGLERLTSSCIVPAVTSVGAKFLSANSVSHSVVASDAGACYFRLLHSSPRISVLRDMLDNGFSTLMGGTGAVTVEARSDVVSMNQAVWEKLSVNAVLNPICALYRVQNGALLEDRFDALRQGLGNEVDAVAAAHGVLIPGGAEAAALAVAKATAGNVCSMLADVRRGVRTEVDTINGYVVSEADRLGLQAPTNKMMQAALHALRHGSMMTDAAPSQPPPVFNTIRSMRSFRSGLPGRVGFVPTMGGLHEPTFSG
jgi:2-dehydropantoate 2-reductase